MEKYEKSFYKSKRIQIREINFIFFKKVKGKAIGNCNQEAAQMIKY